MIAFSTDSAGSPKIISQCSGCQTCKVLLIWYTCISRFPIALWLIGDLMPLMVVGRGRPPLISDKGM